jgi:eukaryotic-like serine/threonine-protein kinase
MERHTELGPSVRFGPFELDVRTAELRYNGHNIHLHEQPFQILLAVLERPGELVSREELIQRLWPDGTFVDYERGLNKAVNKLRDVLRDSADSPRFIETIPRRGYRFIASLEEGSALVKAEDAALAGIAIPSTDDLAKPQVARAARRRKFAVLGVLATVAAVGIVVGGLSARRIWRAPTPTFSPLTFRHGTIFSARFAPDNHTVIYSAKWGTEDTQVFLTRPDSPESRPLGISKSEILAVSSSGELAIAMGCEVYASPLSCGGTLATVPLGGGAPREIEEDVHYADWTPDGKSLVVVRSMGDRAALELPPGKVLYETNTNGWISSPRVSPNGGLIAFVLHSSAGDDDGSVVVIDVHGRKILSAGWPSVEGLAWSAQGNEIWFVATTESGLALHAVSLTGRERLITGFPGYMRLYDISRNGDLLLEQWHGSEEIIFGSVGEPKERNLTWLDGSGAPQLSADGRMLAFSENARGGGPPSGAHTYIRKTDGSPAVKLGNGYPEALSPDGKWVLSNIYLPVPAKLILYPTGAGETQVLDLGKVEYEGGAEWFADGKRILFQGIQPGHNSRIYIKELAGKTIPVGPEIRRKGPMSADGNFVLAVGLDRQIWRYPLDGGQPLPTRGMKRTNQLICWSVNSRFVYLSEGDLPAKVYKVDPVTGRRQLLRELMPPDPSGITQVLWVSLTPDGKSYAYSYIRFLSDLHLVKGLR